MDINEINYSDMVKALAKDGDEILKSLTKEKIHLWHMITGVSGEAGELTDGLKKHIIYNKPLDRENIVEELGDLRFYMEGIMNELNITHEEIIAHNKAKLSTRYAGLKYSDQAAQDRADKK